MKIQKSISGVILLWLSAGLVLACSEHRQETKNDCSAIFETVYVDKGKVTKKDPNKKSDSQIADESGKTEAELADEEENKPASTCKILKVKIDSNTECEIVGSDKIDNLTYALQNRSDKIVAVIPEKKVRDMAELAQKYMIASGFDFQRYFESDLFKSLNFKYKGMRCTRSGAEFSAWKGDKKIIISF